MSQRRVEVQLDVADLDRLVVVADDLRFLRDLPSEHMPSHTEIRLAAGVLRRLLIDNGGELRRIWSVIHQHRDVPLTVQAVDLDGFLHQWPAEWLVQAWAGGARFHLAHHQGFVSYAVPPAIYQAHASVEEFLAARGMPTEPVLGEFQLHDWLRKTSAAIRTDRGLYLISRQSVINYIANRKGGVHFDPSRSLSPSTSQKQSRKVSEYHLLDHGLIRVGHLSGPEYEVASIAQVISRTQWAADLIAAGEDNAPDEYDGDAAELKVWRGTPDGAWDTLTFPGDDPQL